MTGRVCAEQPRRDERPHVARPLRVGRDERGADAGQQFVPQVGARPRYAGVAAQAAARGTVGARAELAEEVSVPRMLNTGGALIKYNKIHVLRAKIRVLFVV